MILATFIAAVLPAESPPATLAWRPPAPPVIELVEGRLRVKPNPGVNQVILKVPKPALPASRFVLKSRASGNLEGDAWLELLVMVASDRAVTVRTRDTGGPMAYLRGEFHDRAIEIPFASDPEHPPTHLTLSFVSEGEGTVEFEPFVIDEWRPLSLTWFAAGGFAMFLGIGIGIALGAYALIAAIPGLRRLAYRAGRIMTVVGVALTLTAGALYLFGVPSGIWIPLGIGGAFTAALFGFTLPLLRWGVQDADRLRAEASAALEPG